MCGMRGLTSGNLITDGIRLDKALLDFFNENEILINTHTGEFGKGIPDVGARGGRVSKQIIENLRDLYDAGEFYPKRYSHIFGIKTPNLIATLRKCRSGFVMVKEAYKDEVAKERIERNPPKPPVDREFTAFLGAERNRITCLRRYGVESPFAHPMFKEKIRKTNIEKYGAPHVLQNPDIKKRVQDSMMAKHGVAHALQKKEFMDKAKQTMTDRFGVDYAAKSDIVKQRMRDTWLAREDRYKQKHELMARLEADPDNIDLKLEISDFIRRNYADGSNYVKKMREFGIYDTRFSSAELPIKRVLDKLGIQYRTQIRPKFMDGKELDFMIDSHSTAIEVNGLFWHSQPMDANYISKDYHQKKHIQANEAGITLLSFTEDQILEKFPIVESIITHKLGLTEKRIHARKCELRLISQKQADQFMNENHLNGSANGSTRYGLFHGETMVYAMIFGGSRFNRGGIELIRAAALKFHHVPGGFGKILKKFKNDNPGVEIHSYVEFATSNGGCYGIHGEYLGLTKPDLHFIWRTNKISRQKLMKHNIHKMFEDFPKRGEPGYDKMVASKFLKDKGIREYHGAGNLIYKL